MNKNKNCTRCSQTCECDECNDWREYIGRIDELYNDERFCPLIKEVGCKLHLEYVVGRGAIVGPGKLQLHVPVQFPEDKLDLLVEYITKLTNVDCCHISDSSYILEFSWNNGDYQHEYA